MLTFSIQKFRYHLENLLKDQDIELSEEQLAKMSIHAENLMIWNRKINLTAIKCPRQMAEKHFYDSIMAASFLSNEITSIADIGSGGGFPGIPLKIIRPRIKLLMIDASQKKVSFLKHMIRLLELDGAEAVHVRLDRKRSGNWESQDGQNGLNGLNGRGGQSGQNAQVLHNQFDAVISRALTDLETFAELALSLLKPEGLIYAMKAKRAQKEITRSLSDRFSFQINHYMLPEEKADRYVLELVPKLKRL